MKQTTEHLENIPHKGNANMSCQLEKTAGLQQNIATWKLWFKTACLYTSMITEGAAIAILGPCLLDLELLYGKDTSTLSSSLVGHRLGFIVGTVVAGLLYHRFNRDFQMILGCMLIALFTCLATYLGGFEGFVAFLVCQGIAMGYVITGITPYMLDLWQTHRLKNPLLQGTHAAMMLGYSIGPLIVDPFLIDSDHSDQNITQWLPNSITPSTATNITAFSSDNISMKEVTYQGNWDVLFNRSEDKDEITHNHSLNSGTQVQIGFLVIGLFCILTVLLWLFAFLSGNRHLMREKMTHATPNYKPELKQVGHEPAMILFLGFISLMMLSYMLQETVVVVFLPSYVVKSLSWTKHQGALLAAVFWAMVCVGRVIAIPISAFVRPCTVILLDIITSVCSAFVLLLGTFLHFPTALTWISSALLGLGFSSFWASAFLWTACHVDIQGRVSAIYHVFGSVGAIIAPFLTGHTFQYYTPKSFVYILFAGAVLSVILFILAYICSKYFKSQHINKDLHVTDDVNVSLHACTE